MVWKTVIHICSAHLMHNIARHVASPPEITAKRYTTYVMALMIDCQTVDELDVLLHRLCILLLSHYRGSHPDFETMETPIDHSIKIHKSLKICIRKRDHLSFNASTRSRCCKQVHHSGPTEYVSKRRGVMVLAPLAWGPGYPLSPSRTVSESKHPYNSPVHPKEGSCYGQHSK
jgi:hypothetical protein